MDPLPPIPTPPSQYWREFRIQILPMVVFGLTLAAVVYLWRNVGVASHLAAVAEGVRSTVTTPQLGVLQHVHVQPYQVVKAGDPVAVVMPQDPKVALDLLQSQLAIARLRLQPTVAEGNAMNFEAIRVDLLRTQSELAIAKVNLERADNDVRRNTPLFKEKLISEELYDLSVKTRAAIQAEIDTKTRTIAEIERRMLALQSYGVPDPTQSNDLAHVLITQLEGMRSSAVSNWGPVILRAPISGMVNIVYRQQGEHVVEGEPILNINSDWADRVVGYMRQPYLREPEVGTSVLVTTRERKPRKFWTEISQVGAQLETITNSLAYIRMGALLDSGLPVVVDVPRGMRIRPGELVDIAFKSRPVTAAIPAPISAHDRVMAREQAARSSIE